MEVSSFLSFAETNWLLLLIAGVITILPLRKFADLVLMAIGLGLLLLGVYGGTLAIVGRV